jgi:hypothetical protein
MAAKPGVEKESFLWKTKMLDYYYYYKKVKLSLHLTN